MLKSIGSRGEASETGNGRGHSTLVGAPVSWDGTFTRSHAKFYQLGLLLTDRQQGVKKAWLYGELSWGGIESLLCTASQEDSGKQTAGIIHNKLNL